MRALRVSVAFVLLGALGASTGCVPDKGTASPEDYFPMVIVGLELGKSGAMVARNEAIAKENFAGCVTADVLGEAFGGASEVLSGKLAGAVTIPGIDLDLTDCMAFNPNEPKSNEEIGAIIEAVAGAALSVAEVYALKVASVNCRKGKVAMGAIAWIRTVVGPVAAEIENPDGNFTTPAYTIDLSACEG